MFPEIGTVEGDAFRVFFVLMVGGLGVMTLAMLSIALWLLRRNRRLPRLVKPGRRRRVGVR